VEAPTTVRSRLITLASAASAADGGQGHSDATLVAASVTARLLGLRILTLDAKVALVPAAVTIAAPRAREPARPAPALPPGVARGRTGAAGARGLADAVRDLDEGARLLAEVHRRARS
jgi:hypothetical protein